MSKLVEIVDITLKDIVQAGWTVETAFSEDKTTFYMYAYPPFSSPEKTKKNIHLHKSNVYVTVNEADKFTESELAYASSYYLMGVLTGKGKIATEEGRKKA